MQAFNSKFTSKEIENILNKGNKLSNDSKIQFLNFKLNGSSIKDVYSIVANNKYICVLSTKYLYLVEGSDIIATLHTASDNLYDAFVFTYNEDFYLYASNYLYKVDLNTMKADKISSCTTFFKKNVFNYGRSYHCIVGDELHVVGLGSATNHYKYNFETNKWTLLSTLPATVYFHISTSEYSYASCCVIDNEFHLFTQYKHHVYKDGAWTDLSNNNLLEALGLSSGSSNVNTCFYNVANKIYCVLKASILEYDNINNQWNKTNKINGHAIGSCKPMISSYKDSTYVFFGGGGSDLCVYYTESY